MEYRITRTDGTERWIHDRAFPIRDAAGKIHRIAGVADDITERKRLEAEVLRIAEQERLRVAANLHDGICQDLAGIGLFAHILRQKLEETCHPLLPEAGQIVAAITGTMNRTRQVARGMNPVVADGSGLMHALRQFAQTTAQTRRIRCSFRCAKPVAIENPTMANELFRIAQEAVHNALHHGSAELITMHLSEIVLSMHDEDIYAERCQRAGARGYVMKSEGPEKLAITIRNVLAGGIHVSASTSARIVASFGGRNTVKDTPLGQLTDREFEVFEGLGHGLSTTRIADRMHIGTKTVETHRMHIKTKLGIATAAELIAYAARWVAAKE